ncbi:unnamed protein product [Prunus armeniaca]
MTDKTSKGEGAAAVTDLQEHWTGESLQPNSPINLIEFLHESDEADTLTIDDLETAPAEMEDDYPEVQDPLLEINVGTEAEPRPLFVSQLLNPELAAEIISLPHEYKDCFAWDYHEMPGLPRAAEAILDRSTAGPKGSIGCLLAQNNESEREQAVHYLSRTLNMAELNYSPIEKLCLALYFAATKLRHYMLPSVV